MPPRPAWHGPSWRDPASEDAAFAGPLVDLDKVPPWLRALVAASETAHEQVPHRLAADGSPTRESAVLVLLGTRASTADGAGMDTDPAATDHSVPDLAELDVVLQLRAHTGGAHAGQVSFPGGAAEPGDHGPVQTALREAREEVGLPEDVVRPVAVFPRLWVPVSGYAVTPVLAHWNGQARLAARDPEETTAVARVPIAHLLDPAYRCRVRVRERYVSPGFLVPGMLVWGFTAVVLTMLLELAGWSDGIPDEDVAPVMLLDEAWQAARSMPPWPGRVEA